MPALPSFRHLARHALPNVIEGTLAPIAIFYLFYVTTGLWGGLIASLAWSYGGIVRRVARRQSIPGLVILAAVALTVRTAIALATGSAFIYFLQPMLGTFATGGVFLASALFGRPLTERLSHDIVELPEAIRDHPAMRRLHRTLSVLWATVFAVNGVVGLWLLVSQSVGTFLVAKSALNAALVAAGVVVSVCLFKRRIRFHDAVVETA